MAEPETPALPDLVHVPLPADLVGRERDSVSGCHELDGEVVDVEALPENRAPVSTDDEPGMEVSRDYVNEFVANLADPPETVPFTEVDVRGYIDNRILAYQDQVESFRKIGAQGMMIGARARLDELQEVREDVFGSKLDLDADAGSVVSGFEAHVEP